jgi:hypothetical protein
VQATLRGEVLRWLHETGDVIPYEQDPRMPEVALPAPGVPIGQDDG